MTRTKSVQQRDMYRQFLHNVTCFIFCTPIAVVIAICKVELSHTFEKVYFQLWCHLILKFIVNADLDFFCTVVVPIERIPAIRQF